MKHAFVEAIPEALEDGTLYISIPYATAIHACMCGCGQEVVTPLSPALWALTFDGETVSLDPSIGSWSLPCRSHYWLCRSEVVWAESWAPREIERGREWTRRAVADRFDRATPATPSAEALREQGWLSGWRERLGRWLR